MVRRTCISRRRGFALRDLLMLITSLVAMASITVVCFGRSTQDRGRDQQQDVTEEQRARARVVLRDATIQSQLFKTMIIFSRDSDGSLPRPGLVNRLPVEIDGVKRELPGRGEEDISRNTTASLYSLLIAHNFITHDMCVSPLEKNPKVTVDDDYNFDAYQPVNDSYWDPTFTADLDTGSNVSYAHLVIYGERARRHWRDTLDADIPVLGKRGPKDGKGDPKSFTCDAQGAWRGNIVFADGHVEWLEAMTPDKLTYSQVNDETGEKTELPDNIFAMESGAAGADVILSFTKTITEQGVEIQHD